MSQSARSRQVKDFEIIRMNDGGEVKIWYDGVIEIMTRSRTTVGFENARKAAQGSENTQAISAHGQRVLLFGTGGVLGSASNLTVQMDPKLADDVVELRDRYTGRVLGKIINVGND